MLSPPGMPESQVAVSEKRWAPKYIDPNIVMIIIYTWTLKVCQTTALGAMFRGMGASLLQTLAVPGSR